MLTYAGVCWRMQTYADVCCEQVGDLVSLSDRDNIETNVPWSSWPEGKDRGLRSLTKKITQSQL
jgi:hypothetical protein